ncbi:DUF4097 family beta strand repeat-containing protein [Lachnoclostridium sp.]|nr:DUF4097 family beta strand repeat-containing protein [Lachnoclostridium sp.]
MKRNKLITAIFAIGIMLVVITVFVLALKKDANGALNQVEQKAMISSNKQLSDNKDHTSDTDSSLPKGNKPSDEYNTSKDSNLLSENNSTKDSELNTDDLEIVFEKGSTEGFNITKDQAAKKVLEEVDKLVEDKVTAPKITLSATNTVTGKYFTGVVLLNNTKRFEIQVNGLNGEVTSSKLYQQENANSGVWTLYSTDSSTVERKIDEKNIAEFSKLVLDLGNYVDCEVISGDVYSVQASFYGQNYSVDYRIKGNTLYLNSQTKDNKNIKVSTISITVPKGVVLEDIQLNNALGDVRIANISAKDSTVNLANGALSLDNVVMKACDINLSLGSLYIKNGDIEELNSVVALGAMRLQLKGKETDYSYDIVTTLGAITIDNKKLGGSYEKTNAGNRTIDLIASLGDIDINFEK